MFQFQSKIKLMAIWHPNGPYAYGRYCGPHCWEEIVPDPSNHNTFKRQMESKGMDDYICDIIDVS